MQVRDIHSVENVQVS